MLLMKDGQVLSCEDSWVPLEEYAETTKVSRVELWPFESHTCGKVAISYADGAMGMYTGDTFANLSAYLQSLHEQQRRRWPKPRVYHTRLPRIGVPPDVEVVLPGEPDDDGVEDATIEQQEEVEPPPVVRVRRRQRIAPVEEPQEPQTMEVGDVTLTFGRRTRSRPEVRSGRTRVRKQ